MNKQLKIALLGQMRAGKDTVADCFKELDQFYPLRFSAGITDIICMYFPEAYANGKPRQHYQLIGQCFRQLNPDIWVEQLESEMKEVEEMLGQRNFLIADARQSNEVEWLLANGFTVVKVIADDAVRKQRIIDAGDNFEAEQFTHETEQGIAEAFCHFQIDNSGTLDELKAQVIAIYEQIKGVAE